MNLKSASIANVLSLVTLLLLSQSAQAKTPILFQLDWIYNAQFAGLFQAVEQGYFDNYGLEVELREAPKSIGVVKAVAQHDGIAFGSSESNVLLVERSAGIPIVAISPMFQSSPMGWMSLAEKGLDSPKTFADRRIGIHGDGWKPLEIALSLNGLSIDDVKLTEVGYDPQILLDGEVDLMQCYVLDEYVALQLLTEKPTRIVMASEHGYIAYSQVLFATEETVSKFPEITSDMLEACRQGWTYALSHQEETVDLILEKWNPDLDRAYQLQSLAKISKLVLPEGSTVMPLMTQDSWQKSQDLFLKHKLLETPTDLSDFIYAP